MNSLKPIELAITYIENHLGDVRMELWRRFISMQHAIPHASPSGHSFGVCECVRQ